MQLIALSGKFEVQEKPVVVLDTNVFVSGLLSPGGVPGTLLRHFRQGTFQIATSESQITEIREVLQRPALKKALPEGTPRKALRFFLEFKKLAKIYAPEESNWEFEDVDDHFLLDLAATIDADFLVTGDKRLLKFGLLKKTVILTPVDFLNRLTIKI